MGLSGKTLSVANQLSHGHESSKLMSEPECPTEKQKQRDSSVLCKLLCSSEALLILGDKRMTKKSEGGAQG